MCVYVIKRGLVKGGTLFVFGNRPVKFLMLFANSPHVWHHEQTQVVHLKLICEFTTQVSHFIRRLAQTNLLLNPRLITFTKVSPLLC